MGVLSACALSTIDLKRGDLMPITLKAARVNSNLTRRAVKALLKEHYNIDISENTLANYEKAGGTQPDITTGKALAHIYGKTVDDINFF
jgi:DNA-binding XRE family transcriptional regulator